MARTPRALENLRIKLETQGEPVPQNVTDALARAKSRDDKSVWKKTLTQKWRDPAKIKQNIEDFEKRTKASNNK